MTSPHHDPLAWIDAELEELEARGLARTRTLRESPQAAELRVASQPLVNFGSNDYLGLAHDARLASAAARAAHDEGCGAGASPLVTGHGAALAALEQVLAEFEGTERALVFSSGYAANVGAITALAAQGDAIYADQKNHASMIDGCRLSRADVHVYPHRDTRALEALLASSGSYRRRMIATESIFSMDGDRAPLEELAELAERFDCMLLVDEAHATGVFGPQGRGLCERLGVEDRVHVRIGTLSKALGCAGGFVVGEARLTEWLVNRARAYVYSTALPPTTCAAARAALAIVHADPHMRQKLLERADSLRERLQTQGWELGPSSSQILPIILGEPRAATHLARQLRDFGLLVPAIRPPSVPPGESLLRVSLTAAHTEAMIERLVEALDRVAIRAAGR
ncbi:MAG: 8-amino-7-oxononanoate synthase [Planctomycetota bacterium]|nr:MAG: 8-amino-7-oxononanoate synthase [Planctomycetota bacterium]